MSRAAATSATRLQIELLMTILCLAGEWTCTHLCSEATDRNVLRRCRELQPGIARAVIGCEGSLIGNRAVSDGASYVGLCTAISYASMMMGRGVVTMHSQQRSVDRRGQLCGPVYCLCHQPCMLVSRRVVTLHSVCTHSQIPLHAASLICMLPVSDTPAFCQSKIPLHAGVVTLHSLCVHSLSDTPACWQSKHAGSQSAPVPRFMRKVDTEEGGEHGEGDSDKGERVKVALQAWYVVAEVRGVRVCQPRERCGWQLGQRCQRCEGCLQACGNASAVLY